MMGWACRCCIALALCGLAGGCASGLGDKAQVSLDPAQKRAAIRMQLAVNYYEQGQFETALDEIRQSAQADPNNTDLYGVRALIYMAMGEPVLAEDNFLQALKLAPHNPDLSNNYGSFLCQNGRAAQSIAYFDAALKNRAYRSPGKALNNAGSCSLAIKDYAGAERYLLQAMEVTPDLPATNANLAQVCYERRDYVRAGWFISRLSKVVKMESLTADVLLLAIKVQHKLGDTDAETGWAAQLRLHHFASSEYAAYQSGAFDE